MQPLLPKIGTTGTASNSVKKPLSILSIIPEDLVRTLLGHIKTPRDGCSFSLTCKTLCAISGSLPKAISFCRGQNFIEVGFLHKMQCNNKAYKLCLADCTNAVAIAKQNFYEAFKITCISYHTDANSVEVIFLAKAACGRLSKIFKSNQQKDDFLRETLDNFNQRLLSDFLNTCASKPISKITPDYFKKCIANLQAFFPMNETASLEANLRNAIRTPANRVVMNKLADTNLDKSSPEFQELTKTLIAELTLSQAETMARIEELSGPKGLIAQASKAVKMLNEEGIDSSHASKSLNDLTAELHTLAQWEDYQLTGGKLDKIRTKFYKINKEALKLCPFFAELSIEILPGEEVTRSEALHQIIG